ncbi:MAG: hypothetical protein EZS28_044178 [Streblomastix strix]|uniref:Uncharacterized protein n=1 Tax=Streblomastix strix TaxID=222440 RepID=A0A5J4TP83_9EUKA|nr:MAG: hypothetical protein EZS28_044178 [Streblomastix strix]
MVKHHQHSWRHNLIKRATDWRFKFYRTIIQQRQGFKPYDYRDKLKDRTQEGIPNLFIWAQKDIQLMQIAEHKLRMLILLKWLKTNRFSYQVIYKEEVLRQTLRGKKSQTKQTLSYHPNSLLKM